MGTAGQSITLANSIIGVGILAMPFCFQQCGIVLATVILLLMGLVSRLCCYFLLKSALLARRRNFEFLAFHVFGSAGKLAVEVGIIGFLMGTCIAYFVVVGDLGPQIIAKLFNINQSDILRTLIMVIVSLVCVLPLGLLRNVDSLSNVSAATICFYFCLVIKVISEAASQIFGGDWHRQLETWKPSGVLQCVPIFSMALFCQTQLFEIFESLPTLSLEKMNVVTKNAINICTGVYFTLGLFGYIAFGAHNISGNILMSLSATMASDVIKLGFVMSLAFSFPLIIFPCRASLYSLLYKKVHSTHHDHIINHSIPETTFKCITVAIVTVALFISLLIPNIELVLGLVGSTIGVLICVVFPAACFVNVTFKNTNERVLAKAVLVLGLIIMVLGTYANLQAAETKLDRFDDKITQERIDKIVEDFFERMEQDDKGIKIEAKIKPITKQDAIKNDSEKDSEVQPPNPVPPESQSNENRANVKQEEKKIDITVDNKAPVVENVADRASESHPKNLQTKLNGVKVTNGAPESKVEKIDEKIDSQPVQDKTQEKLDIIKQQQLIETIKQHGEEQKELIKEQKEILDEIMKTKKELQQNKKEIDDSEAKKIAVESIQKIANVAIKSLSGVSEKPVGEEKKANAEPLQKIANDAVQEIAKKAFEAIKEIKENPQPPSIKQENLSASNNVQNNLNNLSIQNNKPTPQTNVINNANLNNIAPIKTIEAIVPPAGNQNAIPNMPHAEPLVQSNQGIPQTNSNIVQPANISNVAVVNAQPVINQMANNPPAAPSNPQQVQNSPQQSQLHLIQNQIQQQQNLLNNQPNPPVQSQPNPVEPQKLHSHSPDEPQSYKQGEDIQNQPIAKPVAPNVPLPLTMNGNSTQVKKETENAKKETINEIKTNIQNTKTNGANISNNVQSNPVPRQKREVVDCTNTISLQPQDKEICKTLLGSKIEQNSEEILSSKVDLNEVVLPKSLPMDAMIHHIRSLKSYHEGRKER